MVLVFALSISCVSAQDASEIPENLSTTDADEVIAAADNGGEILGANQEDTPVADEHGDDPTEGIDTTFCSIKIDIPGKVYKVGDKVKVKITVKKHRNHSG